jgi:hypothetical protein
MSQSKNKKVIKTMKELRETLTENTDEIIAIGGSGSMIAALIYMSIIGMIDPIVALIPPLMLIMTHFFAKKKNEE